MSWLFGKSKTPKELLRENKRMIDRSIRELNREKSRLETQEKKVIVDIKKNAKLGQMETVKIMAKDLVRTRQHVKKFTLMTANLQAVSLKISTMGSQATMAEAMKGVSTAMKKMNSQMNLPQIQKIMMEFEKQSEMMEIKGEMMDDVMDDAMDDGETEEETDNVVGQILGELGIEMGEAMGSIPEMGGDLPSHSKVGEQSGPVMEAAGGIADDDIEARLANLKRND